MCRFLSAIVFRNGDLVCDPEHTDSHEDLIEAQGLADNGRGGFVRVECVPTGELHEVDKYELHCDKSSAPEWWTDEVSKRTADGLRARLRRMLVDGDRRRMLLGGCWIVCGNATVRHVKSARLVAVYGSATINGVYGSATINNDYRKKNG